MGSQGRGKADGGGARSQRSGEESRAREGGGTEGKRAGDDAHLHAELRQRAEVMERRCSGETAASPSMAAKAAARLGLRG
jgi:hypothetical protein